MYQPIFDDNIGEEDLSPLENFIPLNNLIQAGGIKAERARRIMNQFTSNSNTKASRETNIGTEHTTNNSKKAKYYGARRFKN